MKLLDKKDNGNVKTAGEFSLKEILRQPHERHVRCANRWFIASSFPDDAPESEKEHLSRMLEEAYKAITSFDVGHDDLKFGNVHFIGDRVMILDFELTTSINETDDVECVCKAEVSSLQS